MALTQTYDKVKCEPSISCSDIYFLRHKYQLNGHHKVLDEALKIVKKSNIKVLMNAEIECANKDMLVMFFSGNRRNKFIVRLDSYGMPFHKCMTYSVLDRMNIRHIVIGMCLGGLAGIYLVLFLSILPTYISYDDLRDVCMDIKNQPIIYQNGEAFISHLLSVIDHQMVNQSHSQFVRSAFTAVGASIVGGIVGAFSFKFM